MFGRENPYDIHAADMQIHYSNLGYICSLHLLIATKEEFNFYP